jgi:hypothetical protein
VCSLANDPLPGQTAPAAAQDQPGPRWSGVAARTVGGADTRRLQARYSLRSPLGHWAARQVEAGTEVRDRRSTRPARLWNDEGGQKATGWTAMEVLILGPLEVRSDDGQPGRR